MKNGRFNVRNTHLPTSGREKAARSNSIHCSLSAFHRAGSVANKSAYASPRSKYRMPALVSVISVIHNMTGDHHLSEDLGQEVFLTEAY